MMSLLTWVSESTERSGASGAGLHILFTTAVILSFLAHTSALFGRRCRKIAKKQARGDPEVGSCSDTVCGTVPETRLQFYDRLSPQCAALMENYRSTWSAKGLSNMMEHRPCTKYDWTVGPTGPILVSNPQPIATFAMCTVPKVACTNFRKLLSTVIRYPERMPTDSFEQFQAPHTWEYPNVWHYHIPETQRGTNATACGDATAAESRECSEEAPRKRLPAHVPSFVVGRNPYIKVLSGFLDKMVTDPMRHDQWTYKHENAHLGLDPETPWENSQESYASFVRHLSATGLNNVNGHFLVASTMCGLHFRLDYYLRLEDMQQWFPCWMQGLGLRNFTEQGWADSMHGRMYVGLGEQWITEYQPRAGERIHGRRRRRRKRPRGSSSVAGNAEPPLVRSPGGSPPEGRDRARSDLRAYLLTRDGGAASLRSHVQTSTNVTSGAQLRAAWRNRQHRFPSRLDKLISPSTTEPMEGRAPQRQLAADYYEPPEPTVVKTSRRAERLVSGEKCWWSPKGMGCREYYESFTLPDGTVVPGGGGDVRGGNLVVPSTGQQPEHAESDTIQQQEHAGSRTIQQQEHAEREPIQEVDAESARSDEAQGEPQKPEKKTEWRTNDQHDKNAANKWERYYDQKTADLIYELYYEDFRMFGYERFIVSEGS